MGRRNAWTRPKAGWHVPTADVALPVSGLLIVADIAAGTVFGRLTADLYLQLACGQTSDGGNGVWRDLIFSSLIGALIMNRQSRLTHQTRIGTMMFQTLKAYSTAAIVLMCLELATRSPTEAIQPWIFLWAALCLGWSCASRLFALSYIRAMTDRGARESVAIIGDDATIDRLIGRIETEANVVTVFRRHAGDSIGIGAALVNIAALARSDAIGLVVLAIEGEGRKDLAEAVLRRLKAIPVRVALCLDARQSNKTSATYGMIAGIPISVLANRPLRTRDLFIKSMLDKIGALFLLLLVSPLLLAISLAIYLETPGPLVFCQLRSGWCGRLFTVYKFRTMHHQADDRESGQTTRHDPRCTKVGAFLRRTSLDELPQLWNVLRGEMSLVGPRPHADFLHAAQRCDAFLVTEYFRRQRVKPGLTGWAQVHGYRGAADTVEKLRRRIELDIYYIEHWSLWLDLRIIARTPWAVVSAENAF